MAARDYAFEALAEATGTHWDAGRGELNAALKSIREQTGIGDSYILADMIHERAKQYRQVMGDDVLLTPTALAKHWKRVHEEATRKRTVPRTNQAAPVTACETCNGDRYVLVNLRRPIGSIEMRELGNTPSPDEMYEEYAPCYTCHRDANVLFSRPDGTYFRPPDPALAERMHRG